MAKKKADMLTIQAYYLVDDKKGLNHEGSDYKLVDITIRKRTIFLAWYSRRTLTALIP